MTGLRPVSPTPLAPRRALCYAHAQRPAETPQGERPAAMEPTRVELVWPGKTDAVERVALPFQIAETINRSRASRARDPLSHAVVPPPRCRGLD